MAHLWEMPPSILTSQRTWGAAVQDAAAPADIRTWGLKIKGNSSWCWWICLVVGNVTKTDWRLSYLYGADCWFLLPLLLMSRRCNGNVHSPPEDNYALGWNEMPTRFGLSMLKCGQSKVVPETADRSSLICSISMCTTRLSLPPAAPSVNGVEYPSAVLLDRMNYGRLEDLRTGWWGWWWDGWMLH